VDAVDSPVDPSGHRTPGEPRVVLVGRAGCHLCEEAREVVARVCEETGVAWSERSVDDGGPWPAEYSELVPVVLVDGAQHAYWRVDPDRLRAAVAPGASGHSWLQRWRSRTP
jgi:hypothetical protein